MAVDRGVTKHLEVKRKADVLKQYEGYGYQVAYYLLEDEALAMQAATKALIDLFKDNEFFDERHVYQKQKVKLVFMKHSLLTKGSR
ncbi:hypothetical protein I6N90_07790 [Paenibacillus sp. GSMTC-2017]|uniref:hypothetical protein n=1 Tax=Paenibacillus sp. GSMTC-2017 TaxID=2794350 RepID=UPI0018D7E577|nr:hypothetical protein [Paenibacillus sp. GSMTC-2017]MBH5317702.1 hypothetical protein [Paenibacillus sp. GSMTC-2017]